MSLKLNRFRDCSLFFPESVQKLAYSSISKVFCQPSKVKFKYVRQRM